MSIGWDLCIKDILEQERPQIICIDEIDKMSRTKPKFSVSYSTVMLGSNNSLKILTLACMASLFSATFCYSPTVMGATTNSTTPLSKTGVPAPYREGASLFNLGKYLFNSGKYNQSITYFEKALAINPKDFYALYKEGVALSKIGKYKESITYFDKALAVQPTNTDALAGKKLDLALIKTNIITNSTASRTSLGGTEVTPPQSMFGYYFTNTR